MRACVRVFVCLRVCVCVRASVCVFECFRASCFNYFPCCVVVFVVFAFVYPFAFVFSLCWVELS